MKLDIKSVLLGVLFSVMLILGFGYTNTTTEGRFISTEVNWAMVVPPNGKVLARGYDGKAFLIDVETSRATRVLYDPRKVDVISEQVILSGKE